VGPTLKTLFILNLIAKYSDNAFLFGVSLDNDGNSNTTISHKFFSLDFYPCRYDGQLYP